MHFIKIKNDYPLDHALCVFKCNNGFFFTGYMDWNKRILPIKEFGRNSYHNVVDIDSYQYVKNNDGVILMVNLRRELKSQPKQTQI